MGHLFFSSYFYKGPLHYLSLISLLKPRTPAECTGKFVPLKQELEEWSRSAAMVNGAAMKGCSGLAVSLVIIWENNRSVASSGSQIKWSGPELGTTLGYVKLGLVLSLFSWRIFPFHHFIFKVTCVWSVLAKKHPLTLSSLLWQQWTKPRRKELSKDTGMRLEDARVASLWYKCRDLSSDPSPQAEGQERLCCPLTVLWGTDAMWGWLGLLAASLLL